MKEFSYSFLLTVLMFMVGPSDLQAQVSSRWFPEPDTLAVVYDTDPPSAGHLYTVTIDTTWIYPAPPFEPYYYEMDVITHAGTWKVSIEEPHALQRKAVLMVTEPDGSLMNCLDMDNFAHIYFRNINLTCKCIKR